MRGRLRLACDTHGRLVFSSSCIQLLDGLSAALLDQAVADNWPCEHSEDRSHFKGIAS